uniref:Dephospho-CoA kinase n=1 Tax=Magnetococcus massalia (strain MO-1) TaxID=451514 RepID=A0A1S7LPB5_MAGMO
MVVDSFGEDILLGDGSVEHRQLNRAKLGELIFNDDIARKRLESIVHPEVWRLQGRQLEAWAEEDNAFVVIMDVPLLFETGGDSRCDMAVVVACGGAQEGRLAQREGMSEAVKRAVVGQQMPEEEKIKRADWVIWNDGSLEKTEKQIAQLWNMVSMGAKSGAGEAWPDHWHKYGFS